MSRFFLLGLLGLCGCMQTEGASKRLTDTVNMLDKTTRWGQLPEASRLAMPEYRARFIEKHADWGSVIQLGDSEVLQVDMAHDAESAVAVLSYQWYSSDVMTLHQSVVRQQWTRAGGGFALVSETIVQGDPRLFRTSGKPAFGADTGALGMAP
ncbi:MAG: hypothetical protein ACHQ53_10435 [Polyangiales bacterium]